MALADLAEYIALRENEETLSEIPKEEAQAISTSLHHVHIPKLVDAGAVEYDQDRNQVRVSESTDLVEQVLSLAAESEEER